MHERTYQRILGMLDYHEPCENRVRATLENTDPISIVPICGGNQARKQRLLEQKEFNTALKTVQQVFDEIERPLGDAISDLLKKVGEDSLRRLANEPPGQTAGVTDRGEPIVSITTQQAPPVIGENIKLIWDVGSLDRASLDLEQLRNFFTDASLMLACRKHLEDHGPWQLKGVRYHQVARMKCLEVDDLARKRGDTIHRSR
jgi:hypothetical protein